jgi:L-lactate utilization protein LutB
MLNKIPQPKENEMDKPVENYWEKRLSEVKKALEDNNFEVFVADNAADASKIVQEEILPKTGAKTVSWGGSMTPGKTR